MKARLTLLLLCATLALGIDRLVGVACRSSGLARQVVDIQHPATLLAKLDELRRFDGRKVVLLGDSLVYGGILEDFGDRLWRQHNLAVAIEAQCRQRWPNENVLLMNLGINGALPCDIEKLAPLVASCKVDCIALDIHLRPFSSDFAAEAQQFARPWLNELSLDSQQRPRWQPATEARDLNAAVSAWFVEHSEIFRTRHLLQEYIVHTPESKTYRNWRSPPSVQSENDIDLQVMLKLAQLKNRLTSVDLSASHPQVAAFQRTLADLNHRGQPFVVFYAKENPDQVYDVFEKERHDRLYSQLVGMVQRHQNESNRYLPPIDELDGGHFLDFTHLNGEGYQILARKLVEMLPAGSNPVALASQPARATSER